MAEGIDKNFAPLKFVSQVGDVVLKQISKVADALASIPEKTVGRLANASIVTRSLTLFQKSAEEKTNASEQKLKEEPGASQRKITERKATLVELRDRGATTLDRLYTKVNSQIDRAIGELNERMAAYQPQPRSGTVTIMGNRDIREVTIAARPESKKILKNEAFEQKLQEAQGVMRGIVNSINNEDSNRFRILKDQMNSFTNYRCKDEALNQKMEMLVNLHSALAHCTDSYEAQDALNSWVKEAHKKNETQTLQAFRSIDLSHPPSMETWMSERSAHAQVDEGNMVNYQLVNSAANSLSTAISESASTLKDCFVDGRPKTRAEFIGGDIQDVEMTLVILKNDLSLVEDKLNDVNPAENNPLSQVIERDVKFLKDAVQETRRQILELEDSLGIAESKPAVKPPSMKETMNQIEGELNAVFEEMKKLEDIVKKQPLDMAAAQMQASLIDSALDSPMGALSRLNPQSDPELAAYDYLKTFLADLAEHVDDIRLRHQIPR